MAAAGVDYGTVIDRIPLMIRGLKHTIKALRVIHETAAQMGAGADFPDNIEFLDVRASQIRAISERARFQGMKLEHFSDCMKVVKAQMDQDQQDLERKLKSLEQEAASLMGTRLLISDENTPLPEIEENDITWPTIYLGYCYSTRPECRARHRPILLAALSEPQSDPVKERERIQDRARLYRMKRRRDTRILQLEANIIWGALPEEQKAEIREEYEAWRAAQGAAADDLD